MTKKAQHISKALAAFFAGCFFVVACENKLEDIPGYKKTNINIEEAKNVETFMSQNARMKAKLTAPVMLRYMGDSLKTEFPKTLHADFYDSTMRIESQLFAKYGMYRENESKVFLRDSVVVFNINKDTLFAEELWWDQTKGSFYTDKPVTVSQTTPIRQKIYGRGLTADQNFRWFTINHILPGSFSVVPDSTLPSE
jgi:LPS export ABC transporter protein LptC